MLSNDVSGLGENKYDILNKLPPLVFSDHIYVMNPALLLCCFFPARLVFLPEESALIESGFFDREIALGRFDGEMGEPGDLEELEKNTKGGDEAGDEGAGCGDRPALLLFPHLYSFQ
jgi:hypothetical protein